MVLKFLFRIIKLLTRTIIYVVVLFLIIITIKYITCPIYEFEKTQSFSGDSFYNPYKDLDPSQWRKANFQVQSNAWQGITSGKGNTNKAILDVYKKLQYDIIATSDYQKINRYNDHLPGYIPVYEHGYGVKKNHQVLVGARKVLWKDYPLFQTIHNKQHIINLLKKTSELVYIAHPKLWNGYPIEEIELLSNYDGIEVLNNYGKSIKHWDAALSVGKYVTILGNDDAHDVSNPNEIGRHCTYINSPSLNKEDIIASLKSGRSFGTKVYCHFNSPIEVKMERHSVLPSIEKVEVINDTIFIETDTIAKKIKFIGQGGIVLKKVENATGAFYSIKHTDTYIRAEIEFFSEHIFYLNPICRTTNGNKPGLVEYEIDYYRTYLLRIVGFGTLIFLMINFVILRKKIKIRKT